MGRERGRNPEGNAKRTIRMIRRFQTLDVASVRRRWGPSYSCRSRCTEVRPSRLLGVVQCVRTRGAYRAEGEDRHEPSWEVRILFEGGVFKASASAPAHPLCSQAVRVYKKNSPARTRGYFSWRASHAPRLK